MIEAMPDRVYTPTRVKYSYVREGFLKHGHKSDTSKRYRKTKKHKKSIIR